MRVLLLNSSYVPLQLVSVKRAIALLLTNKAELVEAGDSQIRGIQLVMDLPLVIRLVYYVTIPYSHGMPCTRRAVFLRDAERCQYCGATPGREYLTLDHVIPRAQGGSNTWENLVTACRACNQRKANRTPEQARMALRVRPRRPLLTIMLHNELVRHPIWSKYVFA